EHTSELQSLTNLVCRLLLGNKTCALRSEEHTSELQSLTNLGCRLLLDKRHLLFADPRIAGELSRIFSLAGVYRHLTRPPHLGVHTAEHLSELRPEMFFRIDGQITTHSVFPCPRDAV